jgi:tetratricopeptide (TPR) repeat protein
MKRHIGRTRRRRKRRGMRALMARRVAGFLAALLIILLLALDGGGYDVAVRHKVSLATWALIALGLAVGVLPRSRLTTPAWIAIGGFGALAALTLLSLSWTESDERTTAELARVLQYMGIVVLAYLSLDRHTWQGAGLGFAVGALVVPFFAIGSRLFPDLLVDDIAGLFRTDRLAYPLEYWNGVACWGAMAIAIGLCLSAHAPRVVRSAALAAVPVVALSVYLTYSRFGVIASLIAVLASLAVSRNRWTLSLNALGAAAASAGVILVTRSEDEIARAAGDAGAGMVVLVLIAATFGCAAVAFLTSAAGADRLRMSVRSARIALAAVALSSLLGALALNGPIGDGWAEFKGEKTVAEGSDPSSRLTSLGGTRYTVWTAAFDAFEGDLLKGMGPGTFEYYWSREGEGTEFVRDAHSLYLEELAELGVPGLLATLAALGGLGIAALAARRSWSPEGGLAVGAGLTAAFIVFVAYAAADWMWELGAVGVLALAGVATAGSGGFERAPSWELGPWLRAAAVVGALAAGAAQVPTLVSLERMRASDAELEAGELDRARELADEAIEAESWAASPYQMRALVNEAAGQLAQARRDIDEAMEREPTNWRLPVTAARIEARAGDRTAMREEIAEARRLAPRSLYLVNGSPFLEGLEALLARARPAGSA